MKLSSRKELLKESDEELNKIRLSLIMEESNKDVQDKIEKLSKTIVDNNTKKKQNQLQKDLEKLKISMRQQQNIFEKDKRKDPSLTIEDWYAKNSKWRRCIYEYEHSWDITYRNDWSLVGIWDKFYVGLSYLFGFIPGVIGQDSKTGEYFDIKTHKKIDPPNPKSGISTGTASFLRGIIRALTL